MFTKICCSILFALWLCMAVSAVLIDHNMISRFWYDLFGILGIFFGLPVLPLVVAENT